MSGEEKCISRREFVRMSGAGVALYALGCCCGQHSSGEGAPKEAKKIPIGLQLYSVRGECEKDLPSVLSAVGKMGYEAVEFAGYYGRGAKDLRAMLDENKLKCCGTHTGLDTLLGDNLKATIEFNQILGNKYLIVPGLPGERTASVQAWLDTAKLFNELAEKVKPHGMQVGYHNHSAEFQAIDGQVPWDLFFGNTRADVIMQFDSGNAMHGGGDPIAYIKRYPGRATTVHLKEYSPSNPKALILEGDMKWDELFQACETIGGTEWYIVEYESDAFPPLVCVDKCLQNLRKKGK